MAVDMKMRILVVDDFKTMVKLITSLLRAMGFTEIDEAADGTQALESMKRTQYGLVLSDWNMTPMSGLELLRHVRADAKLKTTPFILITAESKAENIIAAKQAGVNNYIVKPLNAVTLKEKIASVIGAF